MPLYIFLLSYFCLLPHNLIYWFCIYVYYLFFLFLFHYFFLFNVLSSSIFIYLFILLLLFSTWICHRTFTVMECFLFPAWICLLGFVELDLSFWICLLEFVLEVSIYCIIGKSKSGSNRLSILTMAIGKIQDFLSHGSIGSDGWV